MKKLTHQQRKDKVTKGIIEAFKAKFPHLEPDLFPHGEPFETIWPLSIWDTIHTENRSFDVKLKLDTGKVLEITENLG